MLLSALSGVWWRFLRTSWNLRPLSASKCRHSRDGIKQVPHKAEYNKTGTIGHSSKLCRQIDMKESSVLYFSTTKMTGHRQTLKCQGLNLYGIIKATSRGAENSIWWSRKDTLAWSNLKIAHNSELCTTCIFFLLPILYLMDWSITLNQLHLGIIQMWRSIIEVVFYYIPNMNQFCFYISEPFIQSSGSLNLEWKWTNLARVTLSESSIRAEQQYELSYWHTRCVVQYAYDMQLA